MSLFRICGQRLLALLQEQVSEMAPLEPALRPPDSSGAVFLRQGEQLPDVPLRLPMLLLQAGHLDRDTCVGFLPVDTLGIQAPAA